jgi:hypothetical protein
MEVEAFDTYKRNFYERRHYSWATAHIALAHPHPPTPQGESDRPVPPVRKAKPAAMDVTGVTGAMGAMVFVPAQELHRFPPQAHSAV